MEILIAERRRFKRYSAVPIKIYLKKQDQFEFTEMIDISIGGLQVRTSKTLEMYEEYECQLELPLVDGKDLIYAKAMVWRIDPDEERFHEKRDLSLSSTPIFRNTISL